MGLINVPDIADGTGADGNDINSRNATILGLVNGNIDSANIKTNGITTGNLAAGAVTNDKILDSTINQSKIDWNSVPWGIAVFSNPATGQVMGSGDQTVIFDVFEGNSHSGVTFIGAGIIQVNVAGVYHITGNVMTIDVSSTDNAIALQTSADNTNWYTCVPYGTAQTTAVGRGFNISKTIYLTANSYLRMTYHNGGSNTRIGAGGAVDKYLSSLSVVRVA